MSKPKSIMVVMSPRRLATPALHRAAAYAHRTQAALHLYLFDHYAPIDYSRAVFGAEVAERARRDFVEERMRWLTGIAGGLADQGLNVDCDVVWSPHPHKAIVGKMLESRADLVLKDVESISSTQRSLRLSSLDSKLLRLSPAPLMLLHPASRLTPRRILTAVDALVPDEAGKLNDRVVEAAETCASLSGAQAELLSVFSYLPVETYAYGFIADTYEIMDGAHREALDSFAARHHINRNCVLRRSSFDVAEAIAQCARERSADLVAIGSAYHTGLDRLMFGTTAEALLRKLSCDVLLVKPAGIIDELTKHLDLPELHGTREPCAAL